MTTSQITDVSSTATLTSDLHASIQGISNTLNAEEEADLVSAHQTHC